MECLLPLIMAEMIDRMTGEALEPILQLGIALIIMAMLSLVFGFMPGKKGAVASSCFARNLRQDMFFKIQDFAFADAVVKIESGKFYSEASTCRLVRAQKNGTVEISGGTYVSYGNNGTLFVTDNGTITIDALTAVDLKTTGSYKQTLFQAKNGGNIYVAKDVFEELEQAYGEEANMTIVSSDSSYEYDADTGYYVIIAN